MRKLVWLTIGFAAAILASALLFGDWIWLAVVLTLVITASLAFLCVKYTKCRAACLITLGCALGFFWFGIYDQLSVLIPRVADGQSLNATIEASDYSYETDYGSAVEGYVTLNDKEYKVKAYLPKVSIAPGDKITGLFRFRLTTSGGEDDPTYHRTEGIFLLAYSLDDGMVQKAEEVSLRHYPAIWRNKLLTRIQELFPEHVSAFASALLLGDRTNLDYEMNTSFQVSGIIHIIAVSGLHVSILFGLLQSVLLKKRVLSCLLGIPVLFLFAAVVGFTPSVTRACIMQALMLLAMLTEREYDPPTALAFSILVMLGTNPMVILSVSFQLSVGCMLGIFLFSEKAKKWLLNRMGKRKNKLLNKIQSTVATSVSVSLSASVVTTPLVAYYFGCVSIVGVLANLLIVWIVSFIFYGILLCIGLSVISMTLGKAMALLVALPIRYVLGTAELLSQIPGAAVYTDNALIIVWLICAYLAMGIFLLAKKKQPVLLVLSIFVGLLITQLFSWLLPLQDNLRVTVLDVGQGQSILLQSDGKTFLVDCGGDDGEDAADVTAGMLLSQGIARLDGIIVTHYDEDHVGGVEHLLSRIQTDRLILPDVVDTSEVALNLKGNDNSNVCLIQEDMQFTFGESKITIYAPFSQESSNENSLCILFQRENCDILITGDRGEVGERMLLSNHDLPEVELLIAGHHGSKTSTTEALLQKVSPQQTAISVGEDNRYGHPAKATLERLAKIGCTILRTDIDGTIIFRG